MSIRKPGPDEIVGTVAVTVSFSCVRQGDKEGGRTPKIYTLHMSGDYVGSGPLVSDFPKELSSLVDQVVKKVHAWEYRAREAAKMRSNVHRRPGT